MIRLSAVQLPAVRDALADSERRRQRWIRETLGGIPRDRAPEHWETAERALWTDGSALRAASLWWVTPDMTALAAHTAEHSTVMPDWDLLRDCPHRNGLIVWDKGLPADLLLDVDPHTDDPGVVFPSMQARAWALAWHIDGNSRIRLSYYTGDPRVVTGWGRGWSRERYPLVQLAADDQYPGLDEHVLRILAATMLLSAQPTVAQVRPAAWHLDTIGKSATRAREVPAVKVVTLREILHPRRSDDGDLLTVGTGGPGRVYTHRWIVQDHERTYHTGPGGAVPVKRWIPSYVAGPADLPLIVKDSVRVWRR